MKNNGGPAFGLFRKIGEVAISDGGITVRDWFAGQALSTVMKASDIQKDLSWDAWALKVAETAYSMADAMIAERDK